MHAAGKGVPQDSAEAYLWFSLALQHGVELRFLGEDLGVADPAKTVGVAGEVVPHEGPCGGLERLARVRAERDAVLRARGVRLRAGVGDLPEAGAALGGAEDVAARRAGRQPRQGGRGRLEPGAVRRGPLVRTLIAVFLFSQKYFVEGIATTGLKA